MDSSSSLMGLGILWHCSSSMFIFSIHLLSRIELRLSIILKPQSSIIFDLHSNLKACRGRETWRHWFANYRVNENGMKSLLKPRLPTSQLLKWAKSDLYLQISFVQFNDRKEDNPLSCRSPLLEEIKRDGMKCFCLTSAAQCMLAESMD